MTKPEIPQTPHACSFTELAESVGHINTFWKARWHLQCPGFCFRGADNAAYDLNPNLLRRPYPHNAEELARLENSLWVEFRLRSKHLVGHLVESSWEALLTMQQYGFPTRLLDWSTSLAVAAYFAVRDIDSENDGAVWMMASRRLMELRGFPGAWRTVVGDPALQSLGIRDNPDELVAFNAQVPAPLAPDHFSPRMITQQGIYTLHTFERNALEKLAVSDGDDFGGSGFLHKIIIPACAKEALRSELTLLAGVSEHVLFPDLDGLARSIVAEHKRIRARKDGCEEPGLVASILSAMTGNKMT